MKNWISEFGSFAFHTAKHYGCVVPLLERMTKSYLMLRSSPEEIQEINYIIEDGDAWDFAEGWGVMMNRKTQRKEEEADEEKVWMPMSTLEEEEQGDEEEEEKSLDLLCSQDNLSEETKLGDGEKSAKAKIQIFLLKGKKQIFPQEANIPKFLLKGKKQMFPQEAEIPKFLLKGKNQMFPQEAKIPKFFAEREEPDVPTGSENSEVLAEREDSEAHDEWEERSHIQQPLREDSWKTNEYSESEFGNGDPKEEEEEEDSEDEYYDEDYNKEYDEDYFYEESLLRRSGVNRD
ncbi:17S U2 SnRNP complex component HTATSF1-like [Palaemon carinicauda]|uniref:17S U2 SnRNP complex component HTATSF1-like n=1 Tax=Palaemon carinicauda TaxID=392227 RepID=UPI0035B671BB